jgi:RNA polymerase sigma-70 factor (ECF subfamily)
MDAELLLAATYRGDVRAFEALVRSQAGRLRRIAWRITGDAALADDVLQEAFLRILRVPAAARPSRGAAAWLARVTVRVALNMLSSERALRRREERYAVERSETTTMMKHGTPIGTAMPDDLDRPIADALAALSPETRAALWLHVVEGEGVREVAACLASSRSAVSRRIRAGLEAMRLRLAKSGIALAGAAALRGALRGSEIPPPESVVDRILDAGRRAIAAGAASSAARDSLDAALAAPLRSLRPFAVSASAAVIAAVILSGLGWMFLPPSGSEPKREPPGAIASAPVVLPQRELPAPKAEERPVEPAPAPAAEQETAVVTGTVRDEDGEPIASADVYLAFHPPSQDDLGMDAMLGGYFRPDYYRRSRFVQTKTDAEGRYVFERVPELGSATVGAFKEDHAGAQSGVAVEQGSRSEVDLVLAEGRTLLGRVALADGSPVADAIVSVCQAWSRTDHIFRGAGLGPTDASGRFRLGLGARTAACHLRVNSDGQGQDFFIEVEVEDVELVLQELAQVRGAIRWSDGTPASGLTVRATGRLPEPPIPIDRMGLRPTAVHDGLVGGDGTYAIEGLHPGLGYDIFVIDGSRGERQASLRPLSPRMVNSFRLGPGEVKVWDHVVPKPIVVRGHIRTEKSGTPLLEAQIGVRKNGKTIDSSSAWTDAEGFFEMHLNSGPGEYLLHAEPPVGTPSSEPVSDLIAERFGKTLQLAAGQEIEVDLRIFEPLVYTMRVLDHRGQPLKNVNAVFHATFPDGRKLGLDSPHALDEGGRKSFSIYYPAAEFWYEIAAERGGPVVETRRYASVPGTVLPEETITLPPTCDLTAVLLDPSGGAFKERSVFLRVGYEDGSSANLGAHTDKEGKLEVRGTLRRAAFVVEFHSTDSKVLWKSQRLDGSAGNAIDLGKVVLELKVD